MDFTHGFTHPPEDRSTPRTGRTYYRRDGIVVTDKVLITPDRRYLISDLRDLHTTRGALAPAIVVATCASSLLLVSVIVMLVNDSFKDGATAGIVMALSLVPLGITGTVWRLHPRPFELRSDYHGRPVVLLRTSDATRYGQICRALIRAGEDL